MNEEIKKKILEEFKEKFLIVDKYGLLWTNQETFSAKNVVNFLKSTLDKYDQTLTKQKEEFITGKRCLSCGEIKEGELTDYCGRCLEEN